MSLDRRDESVKEPAIDDGNCALHAFILSFTQSSNLEAFERALRRDKERQKELKILISVAAAALECENNWLALKAKIQFLRGKGESGKKELQRKLMPIMRDLAVSELEKDIEFPRDALESLKAAYDDYVTLQQNPSAHILRPDDIYQRHAFINKKFEVIFNQNRDGTGKVNEENAIRELSRWWLREGGCSQFFREMRKPGTWAGDAELSQLARCLKVNLFINNHCHHDTRQSNAPAIKLIHNVQVGHYDSTILQSELKSEVTPVTAATTATETTTTTTTTSQPVVTIPANPVSPVVSRPISTSGISEIEAATFRLFQDTKLETKGEWNETNPLVQAAIEQSNHGYQGYEVRVNHKLVAKFQVTNETLVALDEEYARHLQNEEYRLFKKEQRKQIKSEEFTRKLQQTESKFYRR